MSLTDVLQAGVETAFASAQELVRLGTYTAKGGDPIYDPIADTLTGGGDAIANVRMLESSATLAEREASPVSITDTKFLIPFVDLPGHTPSETDKILLDGVGYNVVAFKKVPGQAIHVIFARRQ